ncbi:uncharacterized protein E0L32_001063 [Thyridium curvatum]|uniref:Shr3 amino acid permease chaperone n=1 Tax=Thyridium curvatum TaxID=1093900 RepID=A0A507AL01_9PEZI|nr:uncharacterized protein E0L32_001063 [Thyridium curvatum]TPX11245.1 hypothetical protein E0L32_001063 [Thyridium curvatum]
MSSTQWIDWSKTTKSKNYHGSSSFATFLIIGPVCFFLGILFASFPYDFPLLWSSAPVPASYYDMLETHLKFMHQSPPLIARLLTIVMAVGFLGFFVKLFRPSEANVLFDGSSLVLYVIGAGIYIANIVTGLRSVSAGTLGRSQFDTAAAAGGDAAAAAAQAKHVVEGPLTGQVELTREDSLRVLSASNTILALVLVGVLVLQAGQWYAERKDADDQEILEQEKRDKAAAAGAAKKKQ